MLTRMRPVLKAAKLTVRLTRLLPLTAPRVTHATPFQPFVIRIADGKEYRIEHPDFVLATLSDVPQITIETKFCTQERRT